MNPESQLCHTVIAEIARALREQPPAALTPASYAHVSTCSRCRAGLLLLVRALDPDPLSFGQGISCEACQEDLPAYIDLEVEDPALAASSYPQIWWHLWTCEECAQTYEFTHMLLAAQRSGQLAPLQLQRRKAQPVAAAFQHLRLTRPLLLAALPRSSPALAASRGSDQRYVLFDDLKEEPERQRLTIVAEEQDDANWQVTITIIPPPQGRLMLTCGSQRFVGAFSPDGTATIRDIPSDILMHPTGPAMEIDIVPID